MKLLKIEDSQGLYYTAPDTYQSIDKITKEGLLELVNWTLEREVEFDEYNEVLLKNQAHQIVYKSIHDKLRDLRNRCQEFKDESEQLFSKEYDKYEPLA
jgi:hypothetical protein